MCIRGIGKRKLECEEFCKLSVTGDFQFSFEVVSFGGERREQKHCRKRNCVIRIGSQCFQESASIKKVKGAKQEPEL